MKRTYWRAEAVIWEPDLDIEVAFEQALSELPTILLASSISKLDH